MPSVPPAQITPEAKVLSYEALAIAGKASNPMSVTTAPTMPDAVENIVQVIKAAIAIEPGKCLAAI